jgi:hypothetical protein
MTTFLTYQAFHFSFTESKSPAYSLPPRVRLEPAPQLMTTLLYVCVAGDNSLRKGFNRTALYYPSVNRGRGLYSSSLPSKATESCAARERRCRCGRSFDSRNGCQSLTSSKMILRTLLCPTISEELQVIEVAVLDYRVCTCLFADMCAL